MRHANRKFQVPRWLLKQRLELFWVSLFRIRYLILLNFGYDPELFNFDQSPYHHNESGSQNKPTLAVRGATVPVVEGNSDVRARWTANLTTRSKFAEDVQRALASSSSAVAGVASSAHRVRCRSCNYSGHLVTHRVTFLEMLAMACLWLCV